MGGTGVLLDRLKIKLQEFTYTQLCRPIRAALSSYYG